MLLSPPVGETFDSGSLVEDREAALHSRKSHNVLYPPFFSQFHSLIAVSCFGVIDPFSEE